MATTLRINTYYVYRLEQAIELLYIIHRVPLLRIETETTYHHWIHISSYCLPIMTFTLKQTAKVTSSVYRYLLPLLVYHHHTHHAVLYSPLYSGWAARHHLYLEQELQHIRRIIGYLRQQDEIAKLYLIELNFLPLLSGNSDLDNTA